MANINEKNQALAMRLTPEQREELDNTIASNHGDDYGLAWASTLDRTRVFHKAVDLPVAQKIVLNPSVSLRELRLRLILEEFLETVKAFGFELGVRDKQGILVTGLMDRIEVIHVEGSKYDVVEAADGLGDLDVVVNGAMLSLGIPSNEVGYEIYCSNMTKLDEDGKPIVNQCRHYGGDRRPPIEFSEEPVNYQLCRNRERTNECDEPSHRQRPDLPVGKVLKPDHYVKANVSAVLLNVASIYGTTEI